MDASVSSSPSETARPRSGEPLPLLMLGALGVVYGDIGTSPLYAFREGLRAAGGTADPQAVLGILSLIFWSLALIVSLKYVVLVMRADNRGEGGILALTALARSAMQTRPRWVLVIGMVGAALFFGDSIITPAISVLSAVEGVQSAMPGLGQLVLPLTIVILVALFAAQRFGTGAVSAVFGPVIVVWFLVLAAAGIHHIVAQPVVLLALSPSYAVGLLATHLPLATVIIGAVFLAVTGAEALYADIGHFGRRPIALSWLLLAFPALVTNYFGQGAYVLGAGPDALSDPFFLMFPDWARLPMVGLATAATVIASQAVISGTYSLVQQGMALGLLPRLTVHHTSQTQQGQIYMPQVNTMLLIGVLLLVVGFRSSSALSSAYGIAVSGVMLLTAILIAVVMRSHWRWSPTAVTVVIGPLLVIDVAFFLANAGKMADGGAVPVGVAVAIAGLMGIWMRGRARLLARAKRDDMPLLPLAAKLAEKPPIIVPGTAIFLSADSDGAPASLLHSLKHYKVLHTHNVLLSVRTADIPVVADADKVQMEQLNPLFSRVIVTFGFAEMPNIPRALALGRRLGWSFDIMATSFFLSRRSLKPGAGNVISRMLDRAFIRLARNATDATAYFRIPTGRVVEIGAQLVL